MGGLLLKLITVTLLASVSSAAAVATAGGSETLFHHVYKPHHDDRAGLRRSSASSSSSTRRRRGRSSLGALSHHAAAEGGFSPKNKTVIKEQLEQMAAQTKFNGVLTARLGSQSEDDTMAELAFGASDMRGFVANNASKTRFPIASNTKVIISAVIMRLVEMGLIKSIEDDVSDYLDAEDFKAWGMPASMDRFCMYVYNDASRKCHSFTFEMLMGMSTGISRPSVVFEANFSPLLIDLATSWGAQFPYLYLLFEPGTQYFYSNENYLLLSYLIEKLTKKELGAALKEYIFDPLGMKDTYFDRLNGLFYYDEDRTEHGMRYFVYDAPTRSIGKQIGVGKCQNDLDVGTINGAGGVISTVKDEAILWYCLFDMDPASNAKNCPRQILTLGSRERIIAPYIRVPDASSSSVKWSPHQFSGAMDARHPFRPLTAVGGTTFYAMGIEVINTTGPYDAIVNKYPDFIYYTGTLMCVNTGNFMRIASRQRGGVAAMSQAFESHRAMYMLNSDDLPNAQATQGVSLFSLPTTIGAVYNAAVMIEAIMKLLL